MNRFKKVVCIFVVAIMTLGVAIADFSGEGQVQAKRSRYLLKVNKRRCVITAYKRERGRWIPVRAMLCSPGTYYKASPSGTFSLGTKKVWGKMFHDVWARYISQIVGDVLFHSVWYYHPSKRSQSGKEFNKLGSRASHGCVRLSLIDAKWIFDNCSRGTRVKIYSSSRSGPLGKPRRIYSRGGWDPTDTSRGNTNFKLRRARILIKKARHVQFAGAYNLRSGVKIINPNANENITGRMKIQTYRWYKGKYKRAAFSTKVLGEYKIVYSVKYRYCRANAKSIVVKVVDFAAPKIDATRMPKTLKVGAKNAVQNVTAKQPSGISRINKMIVEIKAPDGKIVKVPYNGAKQYVFNQVGEYTVVYKISAGKSPIYGAAKNVSIKIQVQ